MNTVDTITHDSSNSRLKLNSCNCRKISWWYIWESKAPIRACRNSCSFLMSSWSFSWRIRYGSYFALCSCMILFHELYIKELIAHLTFFCLHQDFEKIQREEPLDVPPMPPQKRNWKGSLVAPFASNNMLVLYQCPRKTDDNRISEGQNSYFVQVLHNEAPVSMPVCTRFLRFIMLIKVYGCHCLASLHAFGRLVRCFLS